MTALTLHLEDTLVQRLARKAKGISVQTYVERLLLMNVAMEMGEDEEKADSRSLASLYGICPMKEGNTIESLREEAMSDRFGV